MIQEVHAYFMTGFVQRYEILLCLVLGYSDILPPCITGAYKNHQYSIVSYFLLRSVVFKTFDDEIIVSNAMDLKQI